jgi:hypothetical protein
MEVVNLTSRPLCSPERIPVSIKQEVVCFSKPVWTLSLSGNRTRMLDLSIRNLVHKPTTVPRPSSMHTVKLHSLLILCRVICISLIVLFKFKAICFTSILTLLIWSFWVVLYATSFLINFIAEVSSLVLPKYPVSVLPVSSLLALVLYTHFRRIRKIAKSDS